MKTYRVPVIVHEYVDLSDRGRQVMIPIQGEDAWDAVYKLRDLVNAERESNEGICRYLGSGRSNKKLYVGAVKGADQGVVEKGSKWEAIHEGTTTRFGWTPPKPRKKST